MYDQELNQKVLWQKAKTRNDYNEVTHETENEGTWVKARIERKQRVVINRAGESELSDTAVMLKETIDIDDLIDGRPIKAIAAAINLSGEKIGEDIFL